MAIYLDDKSVAGLLDMPSCISALEEMFREKAEGHASNEPRRRVPFQGRRFMMMFGAMDRKGYLAYKAYGAGKGQDVVLYKGGQGIVAFVAPAKERAAIFSTYFVIVYVAGGGSAITLGIFAKQYGLHSSTITYTILASILAVSTALLTARTTIARRSDDD